jgi:myo-inositol-1(or 4)-monophosphatase
MRLHASQRRSVVERAGWQRELEVAEAAASEAAAIVRSHYEQGSAVREKNDGSPVSDADLEADRSIRARLESEFPRDGVLSEESEAAASLAAAERERVWIVDPLDGTHEFRDRIPEFAVSIALVVAGEPLVAVVHNPIADVSVCAARGAGSWRREERVRVTRCERLEEAVFIASRSETKRGAYRPFDTWFRESRPTGSAAWKLAVVACGDGDLSFSTRPKNAWDVAAGDLLVREAGGIYRSLSGVVPSYDPARPGVEADMLAGPPALAEAFALRERARREHERATGDA